jgi:microsomal epoxide hydrolase
MRLIATITGLLLGLTLLLATAEAAQDRTFVTSDGVRLHYTESGTGRTIVLVPGWTMPAWIWNAQITDFSRRFHVVAFDPRAQGESEIARSGYEPFRRGEDIAELIQHLGPEPVLLVGWSLGVLDALAYVHEHGDGRLAGLVLVDNSVGEDPPPPPPSPRLAPHVARPVPREVTMRRFVTGMFRRRPAESYLDRLTQACLRTPQDAAEALLAYPVPRTFWKQAVYATNRPVLYVVTPRLAGQAANLSQHHPSAESVVMQGVGHALFVDDAARFDAMVRNFIRRRVWP